MATKMVDGLASQKDDFFISVSQILFAICMGICGAPGGECFAVFLSGD
jgi:hypothetical protein